MTKKELRSLLEIATRRLEIANEHNTMLLARLSKQFEADSILKLTTENASLKGQLEMLLELFDPHNVENSKYIMYEGKVFIVGERTLSEPVGEPKCLTVEALLYPAPIDVITDKKK